MHMRKLLLLCAAVLMTLLSWAQRAITGRVIDDKGSPLPNVSVTIKGSSQGTVDQSLQEVVVVGYGTQRRADVTGSISSIAGNKLKDQPIQSFEQGLSGR